MLIGDLYSLLPGFTLAAFLTILLWPENIAFRNRLKLFMAVVAFWIVASVIGMTGYGTVERGSVCLINAIIGSLGFVALLLTYQLKPSRKTN